MDQSLFGDDALPEPPGSGETPEPFRTADWQVAQLRRALDACGLTSMQDRQKLVEQLVGHAVTDLRGLSSSEARDLLERLKDRSSSTAPQQGSTWDDRDEDTWIDRL